jgi:hypothetical protein
MALPLKRSIVIIPSDFYQPEAWPQLLTDGCPSSGELPWGMTGEIYIETDSGSRKHGPAAKIDIRRSKGASARARPGTANMVTRYRPEFLTSFL